ncbi:MAG: anti-sigma factor antagonist [Actinobacteria bacterium]|nr:anti-sigma factor antagonist [Actinomycetota bacterium]
MELSVDRQSDITIITVTGSVDSIDSDALRIFLDDIIVAGRTRLVIDLIAMDFIVSMALGVFVQTFTRLRAADGFLRLAAPQPAILRVIKTTALDRLLPIYDSLAQALE